MGKRQRPGKSRKRLAYGAIAVIFLLAGFATYFYLSSPKQQTSPNQNSSETLRLAAIVDQLDFREETRNETFRNMSINILETAGFNVTYYPGGDITVPFYRNLLSHNYDLIVFRVHSAIIYGRGDNTSLSLFTSERLDESKYNTPSAPYYWDVFSKRLVEAYFNETERAQNITYFAIAPEFIEEYGTFKNATIIMMGCDGLRYNRTAEAFINKGAKVYVGWDGLVSAPHSDSAVIYLIQGLIQGNTVKEAVEKTMIKVGPEKMYFLHQGYNSTLKYYPDFAGSHTIQNTVVISSMESARASAVSAKEGINGTFLWILAQLGSKGDSAECCSRTQNRVLLTLRDFHSPSQHC